MTEHRSIASIVYRLASRPSAFQWSVALVSLFFGYAAAAAPTTWGAIFADDIAFLGRIAVGAALLAGTLGLLTRLVAGPAAEERVLRHNADEGAHHAALSEMALRLLSLQREVAELTAEVRSLKERLER